MSLKTWLLTFICILTGIVAWLGVFAEMDKDDDHGVRISSVADSTFLSGLKEHEVDSSSQESDNSADSSTCMGGYVNEEEGAEYSVNINTAGVEELESLPGIGEVLARRIVEYRESHDGIRDMQALKKIKGIGEKRAAKLRDKISF